MIFLLSKGYITKMLLHPYFTTRGVTNVLQIWRKNKKIFIFFKIKKEKAKGSRDVMFRGLKVF